MSFMSNENNEDIKIRELTWAALLNRWLDFARASVSFPDNASGKRWKDAVVPIITLQSVTFALTEVNDLSHDERALGLDKAQIIIIRETESLISIWPDEPLPVMVRELIEDAKLMLNSAIEGPIYEMNFLSNMTMGRDRSQNYIEMPDISELLKNLVGAGFRGTVLAALPGTLLVAGEPSGYIVCSGLENSEIIHKIAIQSTISSEDLRCDLTNQGAVENIDLDIADSDTSLRLGEFGLVRRLHVSQIYRQVDENGNIYQDIITMLWDNPLSGKPLFERLVCGGKVCLPVVDRERWVQQQRKSWPENGIIEVKYQ